MTRDEFWTYIDAARSENPEEPEQGLHQVLNSLNEAELQSFQDHFDELIDAAYRWDLWGAAYVQDGGCSDDGFEYFRRGLIARGRQVYEAVLENPDSLAEFDVEENEIFGGVAAEIFEEKFDREIERNSAGSSDPAGEEWDFDDEEEVERRLPRLFAKYLG